MPILTAMQVNINIMDTLNWAIQQLCSNRIPNPRLDAEILLAYTLQIKREKLYTIIETIISEKNLIEFKELIYRRSKNEPVAYLTQSKEFMGLEFYVSPDVLIPRPETELLVEQIILQAQKLHHSKIMLDIGTGSGCIAIACAKYIPDLHIIATDIHPASLSIARKNAQYHQVKNKIEFYQGDLFSALSDKIHLAYFDFIVSNPPYIPAPQIHELSIDIQNYEPFIALSGGQNGLDIIKKIISQAPYYLNKNGFLLLEIAYNQAKSVGELLLNNSAYNSLSMKILKDLAGFDRLIMIQKDI